MNKIINYLTQVLNRKKVETIKYFNILKILNLDRLIYIINTSLAAQGALAHRLQRRPRPIHKNAKSGAHPCSLPLGFNMAGGDLGGGGKNKKNG